LSHSGGRRNPVYRRGRGRARGSVRIERSMASRYRDSCFPFPMRR